MKNYKKIMKFFILKLRKMVFFKKKTKILEIVIKKNNSIHFENPKFNFSFNN